MTNYYSALSKVEDQKYREYFAAQDVKECVSRCCEKIEEYYRDMNRTGRINLYRNSYFKYFQGFIMKGAITQSGQLAELSNIFFNHYHNLITHSTNLVCQQKLAYDPQVTVNDSSAQDQIKLAKGILFVYSNRSDIDLDGKLRQATIYSQVFQDAYVSVLWNKNLGRTIAFQTETDAEGNSTQGAPIKEGDNEYKIWSPFDVILDVTMGSYEWKKWLILRNWENKYEVAAEYPEWSDEVTGLFSGYGQGETRMTYHVSQESDYIPVYYLFHEKTAAVPEGRIVKFIDDNIILADGKLEYRNIPVYKMGCEELAGSPYSYCRSADILPLQDACDRLSSAILTNQLTFSTQNIALAKGSEIAWETLYGGLNVIYYPPEMGEAGVPKALQLTSSPPETFKFVDSIVQQMGTIYGINDVVKGNPDLTLKGQVSAAALTIMSMQAIQFNTDLQKAYVRLAEQIGTATMHNLQDFAFPDLGNGQTLTREGMGMSATNKYFKRSYSKNDIDKIDKIVIRYGNPLAQTTAGRMTIAETMMQQGMLKTPQEYLEVMETGSLEPATESIESQLHLIKEENEALMRGEDVPVLWADDHALHFPEHLAKLASLDARQDLKVIEAIKKHTDLHIQNLKSLDPITAAFLKQPVLNQPPQPQGAPPPPQNSNAQTGVPPQ